jgi:cellulose synthase/poly-beta-1,6-N-acetylglucosamine synthase-like glycosyltransferase
VITAVAVVVPARDEAPTIARCVRGVLTALRALPPHVERALCVVADRCTDDTEALAHAELAGWPARVVHNPAAATIGEVRDLGMRHLGLAGHRPSDVWLLSTDADTIVAPDWAVRHLELARRGAHAVAGIALLTDHTVLPVTRRPDGHGRVYAANLGVRADAYHTVGGFGAVATGEDHDLWRRLRQAGYRCHYAQGPRVITSGRRRGRAPGGLADLLTRLDARGGPERDPHGGADLPV